MSELLRERRNALGKELKEIAEVTRIKCAYLKSIEEDEFEKLPVEVYTRGYIREYAQFLGIPSDIALEPYEDYLREKKGGKEKAASQEKASAVLTKEVIENPDTSKEECETEDVDKLFPAEVKSSSPFKTSSLKILWIFPVIVVVAGIYLVMPAFKIAPPPSQQQNIQIPQIPQAASPVVPGNPPAPSVLPSFPGTDTTVKNPRTPESRESSGASVVHGLNEPTGQGKPPVPKDTKKEAHEVTAKAALKPQSGDENNAADKKKHILKIDATDKVWVKVVIDGKENKEMLLHGGDEVSYGAKESFTLTVGNAAGARIRFDGKPYENLGDEGQVVKLNFPPRPSEPQSPDGEPEKPE
ncbi:MAG: helix-turn-helix domain-containing protein [Nitrospirae bacterium]|nr:helix-turn-helix domain-containing protein [Nitrospirota bacterium]